MSFQSAYVGIDPGRDSGATSVFFDDGSILVIEHEKLTLKEYADSLRDLLMSYMLVATLEDVPMVPTNSGQAIAKLHRHYGNLEMVLTMLNIKFERVTPQKWQRMFGLVQPKGKKITYAQKKKQHRQRAQELFPTEKITDKTADSLLIAEFCRRVAA